MKKKLIISFSCVGAAVILIVILLFTLFGLGSVTLDIRTYGSIFASEEKQAEVVESGEFRYNTPVFFQNKRNYINNLERKNPYLKVVGIEIKFPRSMVVKCVDREETFAIKISDNKYFIVDEDMKFLRMTEEFSSEQTNAILLGGEFTVLNTDASPGEFLSLSAGQALIENFSPCMKVNNRSVAEQKALFKSLNLKFRINPLTAKSQAYLELEDFAGLKMSIMEADDDLTLKINCLLASWASVSPADYQNHELKALKNSKGEIFCILTEKS